MSFVFPQMAGLGHSPMAVRYAIGSLDEARGFPRARSAWSEAADHHRTGAPFSGQVGWRDIRATRRHEVQIEPDAFRPGVAGRRVRHRPRGLLRRTGGASHDRAPGWLADALADAVEAVGGGAGRAPHIRMEAGPRRDAKRKELRGRHHVSFLGPSPIPRHSLTPTPQTKRGPRAPTRHGMPDIGRRSRFASTCAPALMDSSRRRYG